MTDPVTRAAYPEHNTGVVTRATDPDQEVKLSRETLAQMDEAVTGPDPHGSPPRFYGLPPLVNLAALEAEITAAMSGGTVVTVDLPGPSQNGVAVLNGAALSFVVLCPATPHS